VSWCAFPAGAGSGPLFAGLARKYNRQPTDSEVAEALEISAEQWQEIKLYGYRALVLDIPVQDAEEGATCLGEMVPDTVSVFNWLKKTRFASNKL